METTTDTSCYLSDEEIAELKYQEDINNAREKDEELEAKSFAEKMDYYHPNNSELFKETLIQKNNPTKLIINELTAYLQTIQEFDKDAGQDGSALHQYLIQLTNFMARANYIMADYNRKFREEKKEAYLKLIASSNSQQKFFGISLAKDYVDSQCSETGFVYDLAERLSRLCVHTQAAVITIISSLKSERLMAKY